MTDGKFCTVAEVASVLKVSEKAVTRWAHAGRLPCITLPNGDLRVEAEYVDALREAVKEHDAASETSLQATPAPASCPIRGA